MSEHPTWYSWFTVPFFAPLSGEVSQKFSPTLYKGVPEIEAAVVEEVAGYGKQLGALTDAVLELAARIDPAYSRENLDRLTASDSFEPTTPVEVLARLAAEVGVVKERLNKAAERDAQRALDRLRRMDPSAYDRLTAGPR